MLSGESILAGLLQGSQMMLTVALVDDHPLFREGLRAVLSSQPDLQVVAEASDSKAACQSIAAVRPSVVVIDMTLPDGDGIAATHEVLRQSPGTRVLMLTMHTSEFFVSRAFAAGASGYAVKTQSVDEVLEAIRVVARGETYLAPHFSHLFTRPDDPRRTPVASLTGPLQELSRREREIFDLIVRGFTNDAMAATLSISVKTVETHRSHINRKLRVHSTGELIRLAALNGLVSH
jgi:two-component system response regulator NreC